MIDFKGATLIETGTYNTDNAFVRVAPAGADAEFIRHHIALRKTDILAIPDSNPEHAPAIADDEIAYVTDEFNGGKLLFENAEDLKRRFRNDFLAMICRQAGRKVNDDFDGLERDVLKTLETLSSIFNKKNSFLFRILCASDTKIDMHIDAPENDKNPQETIRAIRPLSDLGTIFKIKGVDNFVHAGSALTLIKGNVRHSPHPSEFYRCVYTIDGVPIIS
jgi:hypothetical protein